MMRVLRKKSLLHLLTDKCIINFFKMPGKLDISALVISVHINCYFLSIDSLIQDNCYGRGDATVHH
jgi:hypothetical protein